MNVGVRGGIDGFGFSLADLRSSGPPMKKRNDRERETGKERTEELETNWKQSYYAIFLYRVPFIPLSLMLSTIHPSLVLL